MSYSSSTRRSAGSVLTARGGLSPWWDGRNERYSRTAARQAASSSTSRSATPLTFVCTADPPISSSVTSSPTAAFTRWRPPRAIEEVPRTIGTKSARAGMYAVPAAQCPMTAATIGTTPLIATCSRKSAPCPAKVEPLDDCSRAPALSSSQTMGMRWRSACSRRRAIFCSPTVPIDPAITVKS